jgi:hypothetical protein
MRYQLRKIGTRASEKRAVLTGINPASTTGAFKED